MAQKRYGYQYGNEVYLGDDPRKPRVMQKGPKSDPLRSAFGMDRTSTALPDSDADYNEMIPEADLYDAQDAIGEQSRAGGGAYFIPSRDSLRQSGVARLKQMLGMQQAKAEAAALPARVAGEYGLKEAEARNAAALEQERMRGETAMGVAKTNADANAALRELLEGGRNSRFEAGLAAKEQAGRFSAAEKLARDYEAHPERAPMPEAKGIWETLNKNIFGIGKFDPVTNARNQASQLRSQALSSGSAAQRAAQEIVSQNPGASPEQLQQIIMSEFDPDEAAQVIAALRGGR